MSRRALAIGDLPGCSRQAVRAFAEIIEEAGLRWWLERGKNHVLVCVEGARPTPVSTHHRSEFELANFMRQAARRVVASTKGRVAA